MARTAVVAGTATAVSGRVARRQAEKFSERDQAIAANSGMGYAQGAQAVAEPAYTAPPPAPAAPDPIARLKELAELKNEGILTEEEFAAEKAKILNS